MIRDTGRRTQFHREGITPVEGILTYSEESTGKLSKPANCRNQQTVEIRRLHSLSHFDLESNPFDCRLMSVIGIFRQSITRLCHSTIPSLNSQFAHTAAHKLHNRLPWQRGFVKKPLPSPASRCEAKNSLAPFTH